MIFFSILVTDEDIHNIDRFIVTKLMLGLQQNLNCNEKKTLIG